MKQKKIQSGEHIRTGVRHIFAGGTMHSMCGTAHITDCTFLPPLIAWHTPVYTYLNIWKINDPEYCQKCRISLEKLIIRMERRKDS